MIKEPRLGNRVTTTTGMVINAQGQHHVSTCGCVPAYAVSGPSRRLQLSPHLNRERVPHEPTSRTLGAGVVSTHS